MTEEDQSVYWFEQFLVERAKRRAAEEAYEILLETRRCERPEQLATDLEIDRWQQQH